MNEDVDRDEDENGDGDGNWNGNRDEEEEDKEQGVDDEGEDKDEDLARLLDLGLRDLGSVVDGGDLLGGVLGKEPHDARKGAARLVGVATYSVEVGGDGVEGVLRAIRRF